MGKFSVKDLFKSGGKTPPMSGLFLSASSAAFVNLSSLGGKMSVQHAVQVKGDSLDAMLTKLRSIVGHSLLSKGITVGISSEDVLVRVVEFPKMDKADMAEAFKFEFDRYFPFPANESVFDISPIDYPVNAPEGSCHVLAAATRLKLITEIMDNTGAKGIPVFAIEPASMASFRSMTAPSFAAYRASNADIGELYISLWENNLMMTLGYKDNGILFRNVPCHSDLLSSPDTVESFLELLRKELFSTINFVTTQFRNLTVTDVRLYGFEKELQSKITMNLTQVLEAKYHFIDIFDLWNIGNYSGGASGFDAALGLALREVVS